jgi:putative phage-type endonuclease
MITEAQIQERVNYLGGSDAAAILGLSRWQTPLGIFMAKVFPDRDDSENRIGGKNEAAYWGNKLEDKVAEAFADETGKKVYRVKETLIHPDHDFIRANIDRRVVGEDAILECKTCSAYKSKEWEGEDIPIEYILQVMHYLAVSGKNKGYLAVLIGGQKFVMKEIDRDEEMVRNLIDKEVEFWNEHIQRKEPPTVTGAERDGDLLLRLYPEATPQSSIELPGDYEASISRRAELIKSGDDLDEKIVEIENRIKAQLGNSEAARAGKYIVTWKNQSRVSIDGKTLKDKYPDIFQKVQKSNDFRVLRIAEAKEK